MLRGHRGGFSGRLASIVLPEPELYVSAAHEKFDQDGNLEDDRTRQRIGALLAALVTWRLRMRSDT